MTDKLEIANHFTDYMKENFTCKLQFKNVDNESIIKIIDTVKLKTSYGFDGISTKLIKQIKHIIIEHLKLIINQMLNSETFPDLLKVAKVTPIYKKDDEMEFSNYRPISLLPAISKIFEKVIFNQTYEYFTKQKFFYKSQNGFRNEHSTEYATLEIIDRIMIEMDKNETPINIYLDLSKALDTLYHNILLQKLNYYGIKGNKGNNLKRFENYLSHRQQYVEFDNTK